INAQQDVYETLSKILPSVGTMLSPQLAQAAVKVLIDASALPYTAKKAFRDAQQQSMQPDPMAEQAKQIELASNTAKVDETKSKTMLNMAKAHESGQPEPGQPQQPAQFELPPEIHVAKALAEIDHLKAGTQERQAGTA